MKKVLVFAFAAALMCACAMKDEPGMGKGGDTSTPEASDGEFLGDVVDGYGESGGEGEPVVPGEEPGENGQSHAGVVTAGEWRDLDNWLFWSNLMTNTQSDQQGSDFTTYSGYWGFYTNNRVAVRVTDGSGAPQRDVAVQLLRLSGNNPIVLYEGRTDNRGEVNLWAGLTQLQQSIDESSLTLSVGGQQQEQPVSVTRWGEEVKWNTATASVTPTKNIDIAFIVDATGSMSDEINFLKADLTNIITTVRNKNADASIRTGTLFYRDEGDDYLTRASNFSSDISATVSFIEQQSADGGGDYPEAVHTALETGLQQLSWREENSIRLAFMLLDAPPHKREDVIASLQKSVPQYAKRGIRIIPVAASGVDKPTEFFLRFVALATDGTYVFLTNDSGVGGEHIAATVGDYQVELLNELIVRLINQYLQ